MDGEMRTLRLNVKKEFFDMIKNGVKKEEYRELKPYWVKRLVDLAYGKGGKTGNPLIFHRPKAYDLIGFKNGYQKNAPTFLIECKGISIGKPNKDWIGEQFDGKDDVFIIKLGDIVNE